MTLDDARIAAERACIAIQPKLAVKTDFSLPVAFPFAAMRAKGGRQTPLTAHWHDCLELNWIESGHGINYIADREYVLEPGQLYLINDIDRHIAVTDGTLDMRIVIFGPSLLWDSAPQQQEYLRMFYPVGPNPSNIAPLQADTAARVRALMLEMEQEWEGRERGYEMMLRGKLLELLALLYRAIPEEPDLKKAAALRRGFQRIAPALNYIQNNFAEPLLLETLASLCGMSRTYFCTLFKKTMGMNTVCYIEKIRLNRACMLLTTTDRPVLDIALESGFNSLSTFNTAFKGTFYRTPTQYRHGLQKDQV